MCCRGWCVVGFVDIVCLIVTMQVVGVHANTVTNVDLRNMNITHVSFCSIVAAMSQLPVENMWLQGVPHRLFVCTCHLCLFVSPVMCR